MINKGDKLVLTLKTNNVSFDKLYLGKNDDLAKTPAIQGMQEANGGYSFTFEVDADKAGTTVPIVLGKKDGTCTPNSSFILQFREVKHRK